MLEKEGLGVLAVIFFVGMIVYFLTKKAPEDEDEPYNFAKDDDEDAVNTSFKTIDELPPPPLACPISLEAPQEIVPIAQVYEVPATLKFEEAPKGIRNSKQKSAKKKHKKRAKKH